MTFIIIGTSLSEHFKQIENKRPQSAEVLTIPTIEHHIQSEEVSILFSSFLNSHYLETNLELLLSYIV